MRVPMVSSPEQVRLPETETKAGKGKKRDDKPRALSRPDKIPQRTFEKERQFRVMPGTGSKAPLPGKLRENTRSTFGPNLSRLLVDQDNIHQSVVLVQYIGFEKGVIFLNLSQS
jgi:hypothetical protein